MKTELPDHEFLTLSERCGSDPLRVQGPGGNTSIKLGGAMWIKASGTELADALSQPIFVAVDLERARAEARGGGDGTCVATALNPQSPLRPSIETTFHALLDWPVVFHTHSVATLVHAISDQGISAARNKLTGLPCAIVPYHKPGRPLTTAIANAITPQTQVLILANHGLVIAGQTVEEVGKLMDEVETRLYMPDLPQLSLGGDVGAAGPPPVDFQRFFAAEILAADGRLASLATQGSYYPDHVVFLGPGLPARPVLTSPVVLVAGQGVFIKNNATAAQHAMLTCLVDVLSRLPPEWVPNPIGPVAEAELLNWDAEKYRQALAASAVVGR